MYEQLSYSNIIICRQFGPQFTKLILFTDIYLFRAKKLSKKIVKKFKKFIYA